MSTEKPAQNELERASQQREERFPNSRRLTVGSRRVRNVADDIAAIQVRVEAVSLSHGSHRKQGGDDDQALGGSHCSEQLKREGSWC